MMIRLGPPGQLSKTCCFADASLTPPRGGGGGGGRSCYFQCIAASKKRPQFYQSVFFIYVQISMPSCHAHLPVCICRHAITLPSHCKQRTAVGSVHTHTQPLLSNRSCHSIQSTVCVRVGFKKSTYLAIKEEVSACCDLQASGDMQSSGILTKLLAVGPDKLRRLVSRDTKAGGIYH